MKTFNSLFPIANMSANPSKHYMLRYDKGALVIVAVATDPTPIQGTVWDEVWAMAGDHLFVDVNAAYDPDDSLGMVRLKMSSITAPLSVVSNSILSVVRRANMNLVCSPTVASYFQELKDSCVLALHCDIVVSAECTDQRGMLVCASSVNAVDVPAQFASYDGEVYKAVDDMSSEYVTTVEFSDSTIALLRGGMSYLAQRLFHPVNLIK